MSDILTEIQNSILHGSVWNRLSLGELDLVECLKMNTCGMIDREAGKRKTYDTKRRYAHVGHKAYTVCVASDFIWLPIGKQLGIMLHEIGHILCPDDSSDAAADIAIKSRFNVIIEYDPPYDIQIVSDDVIAKFCISEGKNNERIR